MDKWIERFQNVHVGAEFSREDACEVSVVLSEARATIEAQRFELARLKDLLREAQDQVEAIFNE